MVREAGRDADLAAPPALDQNLVSGQSATEARALLQEFPDEVLATITWLGASKR